MELSIQIKKYRTELHLSQEELAEKVYVTRQTISNWENEKSYPAIIECVSGLFCVKKSTGKFLWNGPPNGPPVYRRCLKTL